MATILSGNKKTTGGSTKTTSNYQTARLQETVVHELTDDGAGSFGNFGTINYAGKSLNVRLVELDAKTDGYKSDHESAEAFEQDGSSDSTSTKGGEYADNTVSEELLAASTVSVTYTTGFVGAVPNTFSYAPPSVTIDLCPYTSDYIVPGSVRFTWMGSVYEDYDGVLVRNRTPSDPGFVAGQINYSSGIAVVTDYVVSGPATAFALNSLWTVRQKWTTASIFMRTQAAPIRPSGFVMNLSDSQGNSITASAGIDGKINDLHLRGSIEYQTGIVELQFGDYVTDASLTDAQKLEWWYDADDIGAVQPGKIWVPWPVDPTTLRYNSVAYFYLPIDADLLGLDPVRLPQDGRVPIFRAGSYVVVAHAATVGPVTVSNGQTINCARERLSRLRITDANCAVAQAGYTCNLDAGTVTFTDVTGYAQPLTIEHRVEDLVHCSDVQINGQLTFTRQLSHDFPVGSIVSSALIAGDLKARVSHLFGQQTWVENKWLDSVTGAASIGKYNDAAAPIAITNAGALTERWVLRFTNSSAFELIGEHVGLIATGSINADFAPVNPISGTPYFALAALGWGGGWAAGNILRINTVGAMTPFAAIRTVQQGIAAGIDYSFELLGRGDVDRAPSAACIP